jgi:hypothetical protein
MMGRMQGGDGTVERLLVTVLLKIYLGGKAKAVPSRGTWIYSPELIGS